MSREGLYSEVDHTDFSLSCANMVVKQSVPRVWVGYYTKSLGKRTPYRGWILNLIYEKYFFLHEEVLMVPREGFWIPGEVLLGLRMRSGSADLSPDVFWKAQAGLRKWSGRLELVSREVFLLSGKG